ncbi:MAG: phosphatidylglycerophosphatase A [Spirochaetes bacterium]|nr:phosphatidylglycerophosphatase A [Spirochaetota bacterium]
MKKIKKYINIPNILTILRFILIIPFIIFFSKKDLISTILSFLIFIIASITDYIDGKIARKYNLITKIGVFLDPLADKFLVLTGFFLFSLYKIIFINIILIIMLLIRELFITFLRIETDFINLNKNENKEVKFNATLNLLNKENVKLKTSFIAKIKTTIQMFALSYYFIIYILNFKYNLPKFLFKEFSLVLFLIIIYFAYSSAYDYIIKNKRESINTLFRMLTSFFYTGYFPYFPGTFSSFLFYLISYFIITLPNKSFVKFLRFINFDKSNNVISYNSYFNLFYLGIIFLSSFLITLFVGNKANDLYKENDPKNFTLDEIAGASLNLFLTQLLFLIFYRKSTFISEKINILVTFLSTNIKQILLIIYIINFLFFRLFDIFKPLGIKRIQKLKGGLGILIDDLIAGFYSFICFIILVFIIFLFFF